MPNHQKPTPEELKENEERILREAEELAKTHKEKDDEEEGDEPEPSKAPAPKEEKVEPKEEEEPEEDEEPEPSKPAKEEKKEEEQGEPSKEIYKRKFSASSNENQKISTAKRVINNAISDASNLPEPTEEELVAKYGESKWDVMTDVEKESAKEIIINQRFRAKVAEGQEQATKIEKWNESVEKFINDPKILNDNPDLEGKEQEFIDFATDTKNNNVAFETLVPAFLYKQSQSKPKNKGSQLPQGSGGANNRDASKTGKLTIEQGRALRESNYTEWKVQLQAGNIQEDF